MNAQIVEAPQFQAPVTIARAEVRRNGLVIEEGLDEHEWIGGVVAPLRCLIDTIHGSALWWWGDALAYGERRYGEKYSQALEESDYSYASLRQAKSVSERLPLSSRLDNLSWSHHAEVALADMPQQERLKWLQKASKEGFSKSQLRKEIRQSKAEYNDDPNEDVGQFEAIAAAQKLRAMFEKEDIRSWDVPRCRLWVDDLSVIAGAYEIIYERATQRAA